LAQQQPQDLFFLKDSLANLAKKEQLTYPDLAEMVVTFIQDIPYTLITSENCEKMERLNSPCLGQQRFGLLSPYEFIHTWKGDCDTRSVMLYALLDQLGYDVAIVSSDEYLHAMLAVNLPATGHYLQKGQKRYYFWETTATGWSPGMLPPNMKNLDYWEISLTNEL
jgi:hypothetical protein